MDPLLGERVGVPAVAVDEMEIEGALDKPNAVFHQTARQQQPLAEFFTVRLPQRSGFVFD